MLNARWMAVLAAGLLAAGPASAQGSPSADQIMRSLQPGPGMMGGTRGIRPVAPAAPEPAAPAAEGAHPSVAPRRATPTVRASTPAPAPTEAPSVNLTVQFGTNSADLTPAAVHTLTELGRALSSASLSSYRFRIEGHTDTAGAPEANKALSTRRAEAVVAFLAERFHIERSRLEAVGLGEDGLLVQTPANTPEPRNRRVQVINLGA